MENKSESIKELLTALSKAQGEMGGAVKGSDNPYFHSTYADLASIWEVARAPMARNNLAIVQIPEVEGNALVLKTLLGHSSGEFIISHYPITPMKQVKNEGWVLSNDPQSIGSAISYAKRYALAAMLGIATVDEDDDGEKAMGRGKGSQEPSAAKSKITKHEPDPYGFRTPVDKPAASTGTIVPVPAAPLQTTDASKSFDIPAIDLNASVATGVEPPIMTPEEVAEIFPGSEIVSPEKFGENPDEIYARLYSDLAAVAEGKSKLKARLWWSKNVYEIAKVSAKQSNILRDFVNSVGSK